MVLLPSSALPTKIYFFRIHCPILTVVLVKNVLAKIMFFSDTVNYVKDFFLSSLISVGIFS